MSKTESEDLLVMAHIAGGDGWRYVVTLKSGVKKWALATRKLANIQAEYEALMKGIPAHAVYAGVILFDGARYPNEDGQLEGDPLDAAMIPVLDIATIGYATAPEILENELAMDELEKRDDEDEGPEEPPALTALPPGSEEPAAEKKNDEASNILFAK